MIIGLTGGIGAGKSLVSRRLGELGACIIDADVIARQVVEPGRAAYRKIVERFGRKVLRPDGTIDRKTLAKEVFRDSQARSDLEAITHPQILKTIRRLADRSLEENPRGVVVIDAPLLIEAGLHRQVDQVWVVTAGVEQRLNRVAQRDKISKDQIKRRMEAQIDEAERLAFADVVIDNSGSREETIDQVDRLWKKICNANFIR